MKKVLREAPAPFGPSFVERVVWKTNQEVPEDSPEVSVKTLIHVLALMNTRRYKPGVKAANEVYNRSGLIVREFGETEGEDSSFYDKLTVLLPEFIALYDHIYMTLPETEPSFQWADSRAANLQQFVPRGMMILSRKPRSASRAAFRQAGLAEHHPAEVDRHVLQEDVDLLGVEPPLTRDFAEERVAQSQVAEREQQEGGVRSKPLP